MNLLEVLRFLKLLKNFSHSFYSEYRLAEVASIIEPLPKGRKYMFRKMKYDKEFNAIMVKCEYSGSCGYTDQCIYWICEEDLDFFNNYDPNRVMVWKGEGQIGGITRWRG